VTVFPAPSSTEQLLADQAARAPRVVAAAVSALANLVVADAARCAIGVADASDDTGIGRQIAVCFERTWAGLRHVDTLAIDADLIVTTGIAGVWPAVAISISVAVTIAISVAVTVTISIAVGVNISVSVTVAATGSTG
jgi:hypothetical protein